MECRYKFTMCRLCLCQNEYFINIFEKNEWHDYIAAEVINELLQFKVSKTDGFPHVMCSICLTRLNDLKNFKEQCHTSMTAYNNLYAYTNKNTEYQCSENAVESSEENSFEQVIVEEVPRKIPEIRVKIEPVGGDGYEEIPSEIPVADIKAERIHDTISQVELGTGFEDGEVITDDYPTGINQSTAVMQINYDPLDLLKRVSHNQLFSDDDISLVRWKWKMRRILRDPSEVGAKSGAGRLSRNGDQSNGVSKNIQKEESPEQREARLARKREIESRRLANETPQERELRLMKKREYEFRRVANESAEERERRLMKKRQAEARRFANLTPEARQNCLLRKRIRAYMRRTGKDCVPEEFVRKRGRNQLISNRNVKQERVSETESGGIESRNNHMGMVQETREERMARRNRLDSLRIANQMTEKRDQRLTKKQQRGRVIEAKETPELRGKRLTKNRVSGTRRVAKQSPEDREICIMRQRERQYKRSTGKDYFQESIICTRRKSRLISSGNMLEKEVAELVPETKVPGHEDVKIWARKVCETDGVGTGSEFDDVVNTGSNAGETCVKAIVEHMTGNKCELDPSESGSEVICRLGNVEHVSQHEFEQGSLGVSGKYEAGGQENVGSVSKGGCETNTNGEMFSLVNAEHVSEQDVSEKIVQNSSVERRLRNDCRNEDGADVSKDVCGQNQCNLRLGERNKKENVKVEHVSRHVSEHVSDTSDNCGQQVEDLTNRRMCDTRQDCVVLKRYNGKSSESSSDLTKFHCSTTVV